MDPFPFRSPVMPGGDISVARASPGRALSHTITHAPSYTSLSSLSPTSPDSPTAAPGRRALWFGSAGPPATGSWQDTGPSVHQLLRPFRKDVLPLAFLLGNL